MRIPSTSVKDIASLVHGQLAGDADQNVTGFNEIHRVQKGDCLFVDHPKYYDKALSSAATTILINKEVACPEGKSLIIVNEPFTAFNHLTRHFTSIKKKSDARIAKTATIAPGVFTGKNVVIGEHCVIHANVVIYDDCIIGDNVTIHANTTIGSDAFYFKKRDGFFEPLFSCGHVEIGNNVVIGAGCTIDRGVTDVTRIGNGTILDNHIHIGHDVIIGEQCLFAAQVGIAGACTIGNKVTVWGQAGFSSGLTIGDGATILAQSGVGENVPPGATYFGSPAGAAKEKMKEVFALKQLPELIRKQYK